MLQFLPLLLKLAPLASMFLYKDDEAAMQKAPAKVKETIAKEIFEKVSAKAQVAVTDLAEEVQANSATYLRTKFLPDFQSAASEVMDAWKLQMREARNQYSKPPEVSSKELSDKIALHIIYFNVAYIGVLVVLLFVAIWALGDKPELLAMVSTLIGGIINSLQGERKDIMSFYYASMEGVERLLGKKSL